MTLRIIHDNNDSDGGDADDDDNYEAVMETSMKDDTVAYGQQLIKQTNQESGTSICRMLHAVDHIFDDICVCGIGGEFDMDNVRSLIHVYNHLIFDFDTHELKVERLPDKGLTNVDQLLLSHSSVALLKGQVSKKAAISYYRVNIQKLAEQTNGFNHASCQCLYPAVNVDQFSFLDYIYLSHVHLAIAEEIDSVSVLATYGGVTAL